VGGQVARHHLARVYKDVHSEQPERVHSWRESEIYLLGAEHVHSWRERERDTC
jgi:hypothetical protein